MYNWYKSFYRRFYIGQTGYEFIIETEPIFKIKELSKLILFCVLAWGDNYIEITLFNICFQLVWHKEGFKL